MSPAESRVSGRSHAQAPGIVPSVASVQEAANGARCSAWPLLDLRETSPKVQVSCQRATAPSSSRFSLCSWSIVCERRTVRGDAGNAAECRWNGADDDEKQAG